LVEETLKVCKHRVVVVCSWFSAPRTTTIRTLARLSDAGDASAIHHVGGSNAIDHDLQRFPAGSIICLDDADTMLDTSLLDAILTTASRKQHDLILVTTSSDDEVNVETFHEDSLEQLQQRIRNEPQERTSVLRQPSLQHQRLAAPGV
jgi:hypothetical protein